MRTSITLFLAFLFSGIIVSPAQSWGDDNNSPLLRSSSFDELSTSNVTKTKSVDETSGIALNPSDALRKITLTENIKNQKNADVLLSENFDGGQLPLGWMIYQLGDTDAPNWELVSLEPFSGSHHLRHNFDPVSDSDSWVVLPALEIPEAENMGYFLEFHHRNMDHNFYTYTALYVSTQSGDPSDGDFEFIMEFDQNLTQWRVQYIDLTAFAGQEIYIAFRYEGKDGHVYYLDQLSVFSAPVANRGFYMQDFAGSEFPPQGWSMYAQVPAHAWVRWQINSFTENGHARHGFSPDGVVANSWLYTPRFFLPQAEGVRYELLFHEKNLDMHLYDQSAVSHVKSQFFLDVDEHDVLIDEINILYQSDTSLPEWQHTRIDLSDFVETGFNLAFRYRGEDAHIWNVDNVRLEAVFNVVEWTESFGPSFPLPGWRNNGWRAPVFLRDGSKDDAIDWFIISDEVGQFFFTPIAEIPDDDQNYVLKVKFASSPIFEGEDIPEAAINVWAVDQTYADYELATFFFNHADFRELWIPINQLKGNLVNFFFNNLSQDDDAVIRISEISVGTVPDKDAAVTALHAPPKGLLNKPFQFRAEVMNKGYDFEDIDVNMSMELPGHEPLISFSLLTDVAPGQVFTLTPENFMAELPGNYTIEARTVLLNDQVPENNAIEQQVEFGHFPHAMALQWDISRQEMMAGYFLLDHSDFPFITNDDTSLPLTFGGTWDGEHHWVITAENHLVKLDDHSGVVLQEIPVNIPDENLFAEFADLSFNWQQQKLYAVSVGFTGNDDDVGSMIWELNTETGDAEAVFSITGKVIISIAFDNYGELYALDRNWDEINAGVVRLVKINPANGNIISEMPLDKKVFPWEPLTNLHFNHGNNTLYHAAMLLLFSPEDYFHGLYTVDRQTGAHQRVGDMGEINELYAFGFAVAELPAYFLGFSVFDNDGNLLEGATIFVNNEALESDFVEFMPLGEHTYRVEKAGFFPAEASFTMGFADMAVTVNLTKDETSVAEVAEASIQIFPNPAQDRVSITSDSEIQTLEVIGITGKRFMVVENVNAYEYILNPGQLHDGVYILRINTREGITNRRLIISK